MRKENRNAENTPPDPKQTHENVGNKIHAIFEFFEERVFVKDGKES
jgi:hypothetical protein